MKSYKVSGVFLISAIFMLHIFPLESPRERSLNLADEIVNVEDEYKGLGKIKEKSLLNPVVWYQGTKNFAKTLVHGIYTGEFPESWEPHVPQAANIFAYVLLPKINQFIAHWGGADYGLLAPEQRRERHEKFERLKKINLTSDDKSVMTGKLFGLSKQDILELRKGNNKAAEDLKKKLVKKYRKLSLKYHPDRGGDPEKFKMMQSAKSYIENPSNTEFWKTSHKDIVSFFSDQNINFDNKLTQKLNLITRISEFNESFKKEMNSEKLMSQMEKSGMDPKKLEILRDLTNSQNPLAGSDPSKSIYVQFLKLCEEKGIPADSPARTFLWESAKRDYTNKISQVFRTIQLDKKTGVPKPKKIEIKEEKITEEVEMEKK